MEHPTPTQINGHRDRVCATSTDSVIHESADHMAAAYVALYADHLELARLHGDLRGRYELAIHERDEAVGVSQCTTPIIEREFLDELRRVREQLEEFATTIGVQQ